MLATICFSVKKQIVILRHLENKKRSKRSGIEQMSRNKTADVHLRFTPSEKENLVAKATEARMNLSQYLLALSEQKKIVVADELPEVCVQLIKIGTNVNQIAHVANTYHTVSAKDIESVNRNLAKVQELLSKLIDTIKNSDDEIKV